jgi:hypothetical protein
MYLKLYVHGIVLLVGASSAIYFIVSVAVTTALEIAEKIQSGGVPLDRGAITDLVLQQSRGSESTVDLATIAFVAIWLVGMADAYRKGRAQEKVEAMAGADKGGR